MSYPILVILAIGLIFGPKAAGFSILALLLGITAWAMWGSK